MSRTHKILIILSLLMVMMSSLTLSRCGSGLGKLTDANANGMKY